MGIVAVFYVIICLIYSKAKRKTKLIFCVYTAISLVGYIFIGNTIYKIPLQKRLIESAICVVLSFICSVTLNAISEKGLKYKFATDEYACLVAFVVILGVGIAHFTSPLIWKGISALMVLLVAYLFRFGISTTISAVLGISLAVYYGNVAL